MIHRILLAPAAPDIFDPSTDVAAEPDSPDGPGGSPSLSSMAGWMSKLDTAPGGAPVLERPPQQRQPKEPNGKADAGADAGNVTVGDTAAPDPKAKANDDAEPAREPAPAAAAKADDDDEPEAVPRRAEDWRKWKTRRIETETKLKTEIAERDVRLKEFEAKFTEAEQKLSSRPEVDPEVTTKLERLEQENKALTDRITELDVTKHPKFESYYKGQVDDELSTAKDIVGEDKAAQIERILKLNDPEYRQAQLNDFILDLDTFQQARLGGVINNLAKIEKDRAKEIAKAGEHKGRLETERKVSAEQQQKLMQTAFKEVVKAVQDPEKGSRVFQKMAADQEGAAEWNKAVDARIAQAEQILSSKNHTPQKLTQIVLDALAMPVIARAFASSQKAANEKIAKLEAQVKSMTAAQPGGNGSGTARPSNGAPDHGSEIKQGTNPFDASRKFAEKMSKWQTE